MADRLATGSDGAGLRAIAPGGVAQRARAEERGVGYRRGRWSLLRAVAGTNRPPLVIRGAVAGMLAVLTFRQAALLILSLPGLTPPPSFGLKPSPGMVVPALAGVALWGALWGAFLALLLARCRAGRAYWTMGLVLGALLPTAVSVAAVLAAKGPAAFDIVELLVGLVVNGAWGIGTAILLMLL